MLSDTKKLDIIWKKLFYLAADTDPGNKDGVNETTPSGQILFGHNIWRDAFLIPRTPPSFDDNIVKCHVGIKAVKLLRDHTVVGSRSWYALDEDGQRLINWIPPSLGPDYLVKVRCGISPLQSNSLNPLRTDNEWVFDYSSGTLTFFNCVPLEVQNISSNSRESLYLEGYKYIGELGNSSDELPVSDASKIEYEIAGSCFGKPRAGDVVMRFVFTTNIRFRLGFPQSQARCNTLPQSQADFIMLKNRQPFAKMTFKAQPFETPITEALHFATFQSISTTFRAKDELLVVAPVIQDSTLADIEWTLVGRGI
jgi:hypothetical protein